MGCTAAELEERMSGDEFMEHVADYRLLDVEPERDDVRTAATMECIVAAQGGKMTRKQAFNSLRCDGERNGQPEMSEDMMKAALRMLG